VIVTWQQQLRFLGIPKLNQHMFKYFLTKKRVVIFLHHYKKYLAIVGVGAAITAVGLGLVMKAKHDEKR
jgi:hypothetical protein